MKRFDVPGIVRNFVSLYNFRDVRSKGRLLLLIHTILQTVASAFTTGIFYTGFLTMYGISITEAGILTFIPYIARCFSIFSPLLMERFHRRKKILIGAHLLFYFSTIFATTIMPQFVHDPQARLITFVTILFVSSAIDSLFSSGWTVLLCNFYPRTTERRSRYFTTNTIITTTVNGAVLVLGSMLTDAVATSAMQDRIILGMRYTAFAITVLQAILLTRLKEPEYVQGERLSLTSVFTLPFRSQYRKMMCCQLLLFAWSFLCNTPNGVWTYHQLNHLNLPYTLMSIPPLLTVPITMITAPIWNKLVRRYSWLKTFGIALLIWLPSELVNFFCATPELIEYVYLPLSVYTNAANVGFTITTSNLLYLNLPKENATTHITFNTLGSNLVAFLGVMFGTMVAGITGDISFRMFGLTMYSVQFLMPIRFLIMLTMALVTICKWRSFTPDDEISFIESIH